MYLTKTLISPLRRYTLRSMVLDTLCSGQNPTEIVLEGFSQRGQGDDRWTVRVERRDCLPNDDHAHVWGKGNKAPPTCETKLNETANVNRNIFIVQTFDQLQLAHEYAVAPLKVRLPSYH